MVHDIRCYCLAVALLSGTCFLPPSYAVAQTTAENHARQLVNRHYQTIAGFMHPTATYTSGELTKTTPFNSGGFRLTYRFKFSSATGKSGWSEFHLTCRANGSVDYICPGTTSFWVPPFTASGLIADQFKRALADNPTIRSNETLLREIERGDSCSLLALIMTYAP